MDEFSSSVGDVTLFYQVLHLDGSVYAWVGTEDGQLGDLCGAFASRLQGFPPSVTTLLGPQGNIHLTSLAERLQLRTGKNIFLSVNIPDEALSLHVEQQLVCHLSV